MEGHDNGKAPEQVSREHTGYVLRRERRDLERLSDTLGSDVAGKLDRVLARDLVHEHRERALAEVFGEPGPGDERPPDHRVMVMLTSARISTRRRPKRGADRRKVVADMQRTGRRALARLDDELESRPVEVLESFWLNHSVAVVAASDDVTGLAGRGDVASVSAVKPRFAAALDVSRPLIQADQVETTLAFDGTGVTVAILDTGVDATHPALLGVVANQQDFTGEGTGDLNGHGTHCAGVVASQDATRRGIAPGVRIEDIKIMDRQQMTNQAVATGGITAAVTAGVGVASNSWGFTHANEQWLDPPTAGAADGTCPLCVAADNAVAAGVAFVVAAGNEDSDSCASYDTHIRCPAIAANVITVAASDDSDAIAWFSSLGPTPDGRAKPDVTAPGVDIGSCRGTGTSLGRPIDEQWTNVDGTSQACPHVAGVAALMLDKTAGLTPAQIKTTLMTTAVNIGATANEMGAGRVDALAAVNAS